MGSLGGCQTMALVATVVSSPKLRLTDAQSINLPRHLRCLRQNTPDMHKSNYSTQCIRTTFRDCLRRRLPATCFEVLGDFL